MAPSSYTTPAIINANECSLIYVIGIKRGPADCASAGIIILPNPTLDKDEIPKEAMPTDLPRIGNY